MGLHTLTALVTACALGYWGLQWLGARSIGADRIFAATREQQRTDIAGMAQFMAAYASAHCSASGRTVLLFDDMDVITPYVASGAPRLAGCVFARETPVTPFAPAILTPCQNLLIHEVIPDKHNAETSASLAPALVRGVRPWYPVAEWSSHDGLYSLTIYSHRCSSTGEEKSS